MTDPFLRDVSRYLRKGRGSPGSEHADEKGNKMDEYLQKERKQYVNGLKRYEARGIPVYIDGVVPEDGDWEKIFQVNEDGTTPSM